MWIVWSTWLLQVGYHHSWLITYSDFLISSNNFDDFFSAIVLLWDLLVVNNWHVFLHVFRDEINPWAQLYFITWWLTAAVIILNIFVALILDNFIGIGKF